MTYTSEQLFEMYQKAPAPVRALLDDPNLGPYIFGVASKYGVAGDKALDIEDMVVHALLGAEPLADMRRAIREGTGVSAKQAEDIVAEFEKTMFPLAGIGAPKSTSASAPVSAPTSTPTVTATKGAPPENLPVSPDTSLAKPALADVPTPAPVQKETPAPPFPPSAYAQPIVPAGFVVTPEAQRLTPRDIFEKKLRAAQELGLGHEPAPLPEVPRPPHTLPTDTAENPPPASAPYKGMDPYKETTL